MPNAIPRRAAQRRPISDRGFCRTYGAGTLRRSDVTLAEGVSAFLIFLPISIARKYWGRD
jgi:hypothetical protein